MEVSIKAYFSKWLKVKIEYKTEAVALAAVKKDGYALQYVKEQTEAVVLAAVNCNGDALRYVNGVFFEGLEAEPIKKKITLLDVAKALNCSVEEIEIV